MYNGVPVKDNVTNESGCVKGSVMNWKGGITTRAVLYDIAQLKGVDWVDPMCRSRGRSRSVGKEIRREDRPRGHPALIHRPMEEARCIRSVDRPGGWLLPPTLIPWMHERLPAFIGHDFNIDWNPRPAGKGMRNRFMWRC